MHSNGPVVAKEPGRFRYSKVSGGCLHFVIAERGGDGRVEFWEQEPGEVRWYRYEPGAQEREAVEASWRARESGGRWPLLRISGNAPEDG